MSGIPQIMDVELWEFLGSQPNNAYTINEGQPVNRTVTKYLGAGWAKLFDRGGAGRAGLRDDDQVTALVIFAYSSKPATVPVTSVGEQRQLLLQGDNVSVTLAVTSGRQRQLLLNAPLKHKEVYLAIATDGELCQWEKMEVEEGSQA